MSDSDYLTIVSVTNEQRGNLIIRVRNDLLIPSKVSSIIFMFLLTITPIIDNHIGHPLDKIMYFLLGISFGISLPLILLKILQYPYLILIFVIGYISGLIGHFYAIPSNN